MSRNKQGTKAGWRRRDAEYRKQQKDRRRRNCMKHLFRVMAGQVY